MDKHFTRPDINSTPINLDETETDTEILSNSSNNADTVIENTKKVLSDDEMQFT
jgi:hypothetical protein